MSITKPCTRCNEIFTLPLMPEGGWCCTDFDKTKYWRKCVICSQDGLCSKNCIQQCEDCIATYCKGKCYDEHFYTKKFKKAQCSICLIEKTYLIEENECGFEYQKNTFWGECSICKNIMCPLCEQTKQNTMNYCNECFPSKVSSEILIQEIGNIIFDRNNFKRKLKEAHLLSDSDEEEEKNLETNEEDNYDDIDAILKTIESGKFEYVYNIKFRNDNNNWEFIMQKIASKNFEVTYKSNYLYCSPICKSCCPQKPCVQCEMQKLGNHKCNDCFEDIHMKLVYKGAISIKEILELYCYGKSEPEYNIKFKNDNQDWKEHMNVLREYGGWEITYEEKTIYCCLNCSSCSFENLCTWCSTTGEYHKCNDCFQEISMHLTNPTLMMISNKRKENKNLREKN